ncbi:hypothetical protein ACFVYP_35430, partial [Kitasatospora sp. NPDC058201]
MTDALRRTAADDDALLERLHNLAWGTGTTGDPHSCLPDQPFPPLTNAEVEQVERQRGDQLPPQLRRNYTQIGDGGLGPGGGHATQTPRP